jgi:hypothetical protein
MESPADEVASLFEIAEEYGKTTVELYRLKFVETASIVTISIIARVSVIVMIASSILVLSIGIALFLGEQLGKSYYGFFIVAGCYVVTGIVMHFFLRTWIKKLVSESIMEQTLQNSVPWKN